MFEDDKSSVVSAMMGDKRIKFGEEKGNNVAGTYATMLHVVDDDSLNENEYDSLQ